MPDGLPEQFAPAKDQAALSTILFLAVPDPNTAAFHEKGQLTSENQLALFPLFYGVQSDLSDVAKSLPNALFHS